MEDLSQMDKLFENKEIQEGYDQLWFELEIINALAVSQWETEGRPLEWKLNRHLVIRMMHLILLMN